MNKNLFGKLRTHYALVIVGLFVLCAAGLYAFVGEDGARIVVADNLDLFQAQYQMLNNTGTWFTQGAAAPFLHGVTRDDLPSELNLVSVLYMLLPSFAAYIANYLIKVVLAAVSFYLLARELHIGDEHGNLAILAGFAYGLLNMFPAYGVSFSSIPLLLFLLVRLDRAQGRRQLAVCYLLLLCYPFVSYFSYFGIFILGYMCIAWLWMTIKRRHLQHRMFAAICVLSCGYVAFEYRLFRSMLLSDEATIRETMVISSLPASEVLGYIRDALLTGATMHTQSVHTYVVLPVCVIALVVFNVGYIKRHEAGQVLRDPYNLIAVWIVFNAVVYGLYYYEPFRSLVETLVPPLTGFQFNRTVFFNPFLWYAAFGIVMARLAATGRAVGARVGLAAAILVIILTPTADNDLYHTAHAMANQVLRGVTEDSLSYGEFYSTELFETAMEDIGYDGEWSAAYGFHPAVLEYNGIYTIDGYLGFYAQAYKEQFRKAIAPALDLQPANAAYYDTWGARCYLYSGTEGTNVEAVRNYQHQEEPIYIDAAALADLDCVYIFSRPELTNAQEMGLTLIGTYTDESSPYVLHVYRVQ